MRRVPKQLAKETFMAEINIVEHLKCISFKYQILANWKDLLINLEIVWIPLIKQKEQRESNIYREIWTKWEGQAPQSICGEPHGLTMVPFS